jgi:hypothetical protein
VGAGGLPRSLLLGGFFRGRVRGMRGGGFLIGLDGAGNDHFSFVASFFTGADLLECFFGGDFGHFHFPPYDLEPISKTGKYDFIAVCLWRIEIGSKVNDGKSATCCQTITIAGFRRLINMLCNGSQTPDTMRI